MTKLVHPEFTREVSPITALMAKLGHHSNVHTNGDIVHTDRQLD